MGMLILTRRIGETLIIDNDISLTVLGVKGNQVRVGITAPKEVSVDREEIYFRKKMGVPVPKKDTSDPIKKAVIQTPIVHLAHC